MKRLFADRDRPALPKGLNIADGACTCAAVAEAQRLGYTLLVRLKTAVVSALYPLF